MQYPLINKDSTFIEEFDEFILQRQQRMQRETTTNEVVQTKKNKPTYKEESKSLKRMRKTITQAENAKAGSALL
jgi:hypothetical protein